MSSSPMCITNSAVSVQRFMP